MALLDIVIFVMVVGGGFLGWRRRFTGQLGSIAGVVLGMALCRVVAPGLAEHFNQPGDSVQQRLLHTVLIYLLIGTVSYVGVRMVVRVTRTVLHAMHLCTLDRAAGALFSVFQWLLGLSVVLNVWLAIFPDGELRTSNRDVVDGVLSIAPMVFGSETAKSILDSEQPDTPEQAEDAENSAL
jgi:uncharacterized membrane protein required for colicin V production